MNKEKQQEIELKLQVTDSEAWPRIAAFIRSLPGGRNQGETAMAARYFDTAELALHKNRAAYRIRREDDALVATLKAGGSSTNGLHRRLEVNVPVESAQADLSVFAGIEEIAAVVASLQRAKLQVVAETDFVRETVLLDSSGTLIEIALDRGIIRAGAKTAPILEVELELKSGAQQEIERLGAVLCQNLPLRPEPQSKFYRGLLLSGLLAKPKQPQK